MRARSVLITLFAVAAAGRPAVAQVGFVKRVWKNPADVWKALDPTNPKN
jgi:hypothetical protein